jgi:hypothetical protein
MKKEIDLVQSKILFNKPITQADLKYEWDIYHSEWWVEDGWLTGKNPGNHPGMAVLKQDFKGNTLVEFEARTVLPCTHDINFMWNGSWDTKIDKRDLAYVAGLQGWWNGKVGIEKSPEYKFMCGTGLLNFVPGKTYKIMGGSIDGHCFIYADDKLLLEAMDPNPIDHQKYCKVGFEAYASYIQIKNVIIREISWKEISMDYKAEF